MEEINDILGFDPTQLSVFNQAEGKSNFSSNVYKPRPEDSKSEDGIYRSLIKVIYNPFDLKNSIIERQSYYLEDANGGFEVVSKLTMNDTSCPIFKAWKTCHYSKNLALKAQAETAGKDGNGLFHKRFARFVLIQVLEDDNNPDVVGKYMFWKCPKFVWDMIENKMKPKDPKKSPIPVMDFLFGRAIELEVTPGPGNPGDERYRRETSYSTSVLTDDPYACTNPDGSSLLSSEQQDILDEYIDDMKTVWKEKDPDKRAVAKTAIDGKANTKALRGFYAEVMNKIKEFAPNLVEEMSYKEWNAETFARVEKWINTVLSCNDPASPAAAIQEASAPATSAPSTTSAPAPKPAEEVDDDLPF